VALERKSASQTKRLVDISTVLVSYDAILGKTLAVDNGFQKMTPPLGGVSALQKLVMAGIITVPVPRTMGI
tara:strand:- start:86 stop:298 length:213 start_codon:yes stop_codon:yes gene_type:complete